MRKISFILLLAAVLFSSCAESEKSALIKTINELEAKVDNGDVASVQALADQYDSFVHLHSDDIETCGRYLYREAVLFYRSRKYGNAIELLDKGVSTFKASSATPNSLLLLATCYDEGQSNDSKAREYAKRFIEEFPNHKDKASADFILQPLKVKLKSRIKDLEDELYNNTDSTAAPIDRNKLNSLVRLYDNYSYNFKDEADAPEILFKTIETARALRDRTKALSTANRLYSNYPNHPKAPDALFLQGFIYENDHKDLENAKIKYSEFLKKYPKHAMADDVQFSLKHLGMTPDEIVKSFEKKNK